LHGPIPNFQSFPQNGPLVKLKKFRNPIALSPDVVISSSSQKNHHIYASSHSQNRAGKEFMIDSALHMIVQSPAGLAAYLQQMYYSVLAVEAITSYQRPKSFASFQCS
jgi:hypothetical protein